MIDFKCNCAICHKLISKKDRERYQHEVDGIKLCFKHYEMLLKNGLLIEGMDDEWHFAPEKDVEELIKML